MIASMNRITMGISTLTSKWIWYQYLQADPNNWEINTSWGIKVRSLSNWKNLRAQEILVSATVNLLVVMDANMFGPIMLWFPAVTKESKIKEMSCTVVIQGILRTQEIFKRRTRNWIAICSSLKVIVRKSLKLPAN